MSLTSGRGPLSNDPAGRFSAPVPAALAYVEPFQRRVRALLAGVTVIDSERVVLVHRPGAPPSYAFPTEDVKIPSNEEPLADRYVRVAWDAVDEWYEEEQRVFLHPRNPYHRVDCFPTHRRLRVELGDTVLVDSTDTIGVFETALAPRLYVEPAQLLVDLEPSPTTSYCPSKGPASYWTVTVGTTRVEDAAWSYDDPYPECLIIGGLLSFDENRVTVMAEFPPGDLLHRF